MLAIWQAYSIVSFTCILWYPVPFEQFLDILLHKLRLPQLYVGKTNMVFLLWELQRLFPSDSLRARTQPAHILSLKT